MKPFMKNTDLHYFMLEAAEVESWEKVGAVCFSEVVMRKTKNTIKNKFEAILHFIWYWKFFKKEIRKNYFIFAFSNILFADETCFDYLIKWS